MTEDSARPTLTTRPFRIVLGVVPLLALIVSLAACAGFPFTAASAPTTTIRTATESSVALPTQTSTFSLPEAISQWRTTCGQTMFAQVSTTTYTVASDEVKLVGGGGDPSTLIHDANQALSLTDQWQACADQTSSFDVDLDTALTNEIKAERGHWQYYAVGDTTSQNELAASELATSTSRAVTTQLCVDGDPVMQSC